jgi:peptidoglycan/xylan/chitin deacetylase (PgdA/CDA1 family)
MRRGADRSWCRAPVARLMPRGAMALVVASVLALSAPLQAASPERCRGTVYLTFDTGSMSQAQYIADTLRRHQVRATFFLANEKTVNGDTSLDPAWAGYWKSLAADGHAFGNHTWRHWYFRGDNADGTVSYASYDGRNRTTLDRVALCAELEQVNGAFKQMTGRALDPIWRAPGGRTTPRALELAAACGYKEHVGWSAAGFIGDELPSDRYPNDALLAKALRDLKDGDVTMMHLGIWSRKQPLAPILGDLIAGLKSRGFCFATIPERAR